MAKEETQFAKKGVNEKFPTQETTVNANTLLVPGRSSGTQPSTPVDETTVQRDNPLQIVQQPPTDQGGDRDMQTFTGNAESPQLSLVCSQPRAGHKSSIQKQADENKHKTGICILCACTNAWCAEERIEPSDAVERMRECFEDKLGYLVIQIGTAITSQHLDEALQELSMVQLPPSYCRVIFYYFGHGNDHSICLADKDVEREYIIDRLQSMCPSHPSDLFKIILFDSCRTVTPATHPIQVQDDNVTTLNALSGGTPTSFTKRQGYPRSTNTLVINATDYNSRAYYISDPSIQVHGCGLVTWYLTDLAPKRNASLGDVLTEIRKKVDHYTREHPKDIHHPQLLVCEHRLMGIVNLLVESKGSARVRPVDVSVSPFVLSTNVHWKFADNAEKNIKGFLVKVTPGDQHREDEDVMTPDIFIPSKERFATLSSLKPSTMYHINVVAVYKDELQAESEEHRFATADRSSPQSITITTEAEEATVEWSFPGDVSELSKFIVMAEAGGEQEPIELAIHDVQKTKAVLRPLQLSSKYVVAVTAVYRDGIEKKSSREFFNQCDLKAATNLCAAVIHLHPLMVEVKWLYEGEEQSPLPTGFRVVVMADDGSTPLESQIRSSHREAALELKHSTAYSLKVVTKYGEYTKRESEELEFMTPSEDEGMPTVGEIENIRSNSAEVLIFDPPFLKKTEYGDRVQLTDYTIVRQSHRDQESNAEISEFSYDVSSSTPEASPGRPHRVRLAGLMPGKKYNLRVRANYSSGDSIPSEVQEFKTKPAVTQKICLGISISMLVLVFAMLAFSYAPYHSYLQGNGDCLANYILSNDTVQCGYGNSLQYDGAEIKGCPLENDQLKKPINVWQIPDDQLVLYSRKLKPVLSEDHITGHSNFLLWGWKIYTWRDSVIDGFCCITNNNEEVETASLHIFRHDNDVSKFRRGESARNAVLSEQIRVPPNKTSCFQKWGINSPFTVVHSSYHYIGVDLPPNMNYTGNITVTQTYVNISDYPNSKPKQFRYDNHTYFMYPETGLHRENYLFICQAQLAESDPGSMHVCTCNNPYSWKKRMFTFAIVCGTIGVLYTFSILTCYFLYVKLYSRVRNQHWPSFRNGPRYARVNEQSTEMQILV